MSNEIYLNYWNHLPSKAINRTQTIKAELAQLWNSIKDEESSSFVKEKNLFKKDNNRLFAWLLLLNEKNSIRLIEFAINELDTLPLLNSLTCFELLSLSRNDIILKEQVFLMLNAKFPKENNVSIFNFQEDETNSFIESLSKYGNTIMNGKEIYFNNELNFSNCVSIQQAIKKVIPDLGKSTYNQILSIIQKDNLLYLTSLHSISKMRKYIKNIDYFSSWVDSYKIENETKYNMVSKIFDFFPNIEEERILKFIEETLSSPNSLIAIKDILFQLNFVINKCNFTGLDINEKKYNSLKKLHDEVSLLYLKFVKNNKNKPLHLIERFRGLEQLNGSLFTFRQKTFTVVIPEDSHTLVHWGTTLSNCIASYTDSATDGDCILIGLLDESGELKFNAEWVNNRLVQMVGFADEKASDTMSNHFTLFIRQFRIMENKNFIPPNAERVITAKEKFEDTGSVFLENRVHKSCNEQLNNLVEGFPFGSLVEIDYFDVNFIINNIEKIKPDLNLVLLDHKERVFNIGEFLLIGSQNIDSIISSISNVIKTEDKFILINVSSFKNSSEMASSLFKIKELIKNTKSVIAVIHDFLNPTIGISSTPNIPLAIQSIRNVVEFSLGFQKHKTGTKIIVKKFHKELKNRLIEL